jgi:hypothetical protein
MKTIVLSLVLSIAAFGATVSSITCAGQTATVNATAHGLVASQGFSLAGTAASFNSSISSVTTNAFTFVLPAGTACSGFTSGYTSVAPAKQIIDISSNANPANATVTLNYLYWFTTAYPNPIPCDLPVTSGDPPVTTNTGCPQSVWARASAAENAAIVAGTTVETYGSLTIPASTSAATVQTTVISQYNAMQAGFANYLLAGGYSWNGTAWAKN